ncbi:MAG: hypothetical protein WBP56_01630 [Polyangia bacterium]
MTDEPGRTPKSEEKPAHRRLSSWSAHAIRLDRDQYFRALQKAEQWLA